MIVRIVTVVPGVATVEVLHTDAQGLVLVADGGGEVGVVVVVADPPVPALQTTARGVGVGGGGVGVLRVVAKVLLVADGDGAIVTLVVPAVLTCLIAASGIVATIIVPDQTMFCPLHTNKILPEVIAGSHPEASIIADQETSSLLWSTDLSLPVLVDTAVPLQTIVAEHGARRGAHVAGGGRGGVESEVEVIAHVLLAHAHCALETISEDAVLTNLGHENCGVNMIHKI